MSESCHWKNLLSLLSWKKFTWIILVLFLQGAAFATTGRDYLDKFTQYTQWSQNLPTTPDQAFLLFISNNTPLAQKLRERWLYQLAYNKKWSTFSHYYQDTTDINLQCYAQIALYQQGQREQAVTAGQKLWLTGVSQPKACDNLFTLLLKNHEINEKLIYQRLVLALANHNLSLANYLLRQYSPPQLNEIQILSKLSQNPKRIEQLTPSELHSAFYLYGLERLVSINLNKAIQYWQLAKTRRLLTHAQQQAFLANVALYKAMRNQPDSPEWFAKVEPAFYNETLLGWQIRFSLKYKQWKRVAYLINHSGDKETPCWQYWLARATEAQGKKADAVTLYQNLAKSRNYYGFLASLRLKTAPSFENERPVTSKKIIKPYQPFTDQIHALYHSKQTLQASRLLNDFVSELPKDDKSALIYWIDHELQWHGKSVYLSNNEQLSNQLSLRFPLAYQDTVGAYAKNYQIPKGLIYAIIRQESGFRDDVVSSAGAQGLMQLMPATAKSISKHEKIAYIDKKQLFLSKKNIEIGVAYLKELTKRFKNHPILIAAAYNAGPKQVNYWLKNHPPEEIDIWVETLPWQETRNYLKNIIAFYAVYQYRMQEKSDLTLFMKHFK